MITRGTIIGKIIDDLARLMSQIELRNKVGLLDLTKISEDFFRELLNVVYDLNLNNLNDERSNEPGIDLGDIKSRTAFQITSTRTSEKISNTLEKITDQQLEEYDNFKILIIGKKQTTYSITEELLEKTHFKTDKNILDLFDITREIATLEIDKLEDLFMFFKRSFRDLIIELEPMDSDGNFESSIYHYVEQIPNNPPQNLDNMDKHYGEKHTLSEYVFLYHKLASIPKSQREYISIIAERGVLDDSGLSYRYGIFCTKLSAILQIDEGKLFHQLAYLEEESLVYFSDSKDVYDRPAHKYEIANETLNYLITFLKETQLSIRKTIVGMDFTVL